MPTPLQVPGWCSSVHLMGRGPTIHPGCSQHLWAISERDTHTIPVVSQGHKRLLQVRGPPSSIPASCVSL